MNNKILPTIITNKTLPAAWQAAAQAQLENSEEICAWLEINLDAALHFKKSLLLITNRRLVSITSVDVNASEKHAIYPFKAH